MILTKNGFLGIGTMTPADMLEVKGNINISDPSKGLIFGDATLQQTASPWLKSGNNTYLDNENVGLGVILPTEKLEINGNLKINDVNYGIIFGDGTVQKSAAINSQWFQNGNDIGYSLGNLIVSNGNFSFGSAGTGITFADGTSLTSASFLQTFVSSQWTNNTNGIHYDAGNVGVGTSAISTAKLCIQSNNENAVQLTATPSNTNSTVFTTFVNAGATGTSETAKAYNLVENGFERMNIYGDGTISINKRANWDGNAHGLKAIIVNEQNGNTGTPQEKFVVYNDGRVFAREIKVSLINPWPDYVFEKNYHLMPLSDLRSYIFTNKHLPNMKSAIEMKNEGLDMEKTLNKQQEKIEELTLYILQLEERLSNLEGK